MAFHIQGIPFLQVLEILLCMDIEFCQVCIKILLFVFLMWFILYYLIVR
jgi:hypothetical protein